MRDTISYVTFASLVLLQFYNIIDELLKTYLLLKSGKGPGALLGINVRKQIILK